MAIVNHIKMKQNALLTQMMESFFAKPVEEKNLFHSTKESHGSGYLELVFDNRDSVRDKEIRQVFQVRMGAEGNIPGRKSSQLPNSIAGNEIMRDLLPNSSCSWRVLSDLTNCH